MPGEPALDNFTSRTILWINYSPGEQTCVL
jgi:hypothetical protein